MILRATFENIYSFKEETSISFVAGKGTVHPAHVSRAQKRDVHLTFEKEPRYSI